MFIVFNVNDFYSSLAKKFLYDVATIRLRVILIIRLRFDYVPHTSSVHYSDGVEQEGQTEAGCISLYWYYCLSLIIVTETARVTKPFKGNKINIRENENNPKGNKLSIGENEKNPTYLIFGSDAITRVAFQH